MFFNNFGTGLGNPYTSYEYDRLNSQTHLPSFTNDVETKSKFPSLKELLSLDGSVISEDLSEKINALLHTDEISYLRWKLDNQLNEKMSLFFFYSGEPVLLSNREHWHGNFRVYLFLLGPKPSSSAITAEKGSITGRLTDIAKRFLEYPPTEVILTHKDANDSSFLPTGLWWELMLSPLKVQKLTVAGGQLPSPLASQVQNPWSLPSTLINLRLDNITTKADSYRMGSITDACSLVKLQLTNLDPTLTQRIIHDTCSLPLLKIIEALPKSWSLTDALESFPDSFDPEESWKSLESICLGVIDHLALDKGYELPVIAWRLPSKVQNLEIGIKLQVLKTLTMLLESSNERKTDAMNASAKDLVDKFHWHESLKKVVFVTEPVLDDDAQIDGLSQKWQGPLGSEIVIERVECDFGEWVQKKGLYL